MTLKKYIIKENLKICFLWYIHVEGEVDIFKSHNVQKAWESLGRYQRILSDVRHENTHGSF